MSKVQVHVDSLEDMGKRFISAWKRAEAAERVDKGDPSRPGGSD